ncbi:hypothetical protein B296_00042459 [Ensete ventricosum]|uniref:Fatty acid hydroxylase domain-containing protein n=1 Tax=Ensete ventricosum TaxID=4639 RepID=A0A426XNH2_ENSVE|nr:hypothetical protein B296_00042459 [Ensete ventricosum]
MAAGEWRDGRAGGWWLHLLLLFVLRSLTYQLWFSFANMLFLTRTRRVIKDGVDFKQIDSEWDWDNFLILQALLGSVVLCRAPSLEEMPLLQLKGCVIALVLHVVVSEPLFYMAHRCFHRGYLFTHYHSIHHSSPVPQPITGTYTKHLLLSSHGHLMNQLMPGGVGHWTSRVWHAIGAPRPECGDGGAAAWGVRYGAWLSEPGVWLRPRLRLPAVHGIQQRGGVAFLALRGPTRKKDQVPDFVFLAHVIDVISSMHVPFVFRSISSMAFTNYIFLLVFWPIAFLVMLFMWAFSKAFLLSFYTLRGRLHQTWVVPRYGFQVLLSSSTSPSDCHRKPL